MDHTITPASLLRVREEERNRLARELHDGPAQLVANAIFDLEFCEKLLDRQPDQVKTELGAMKERLKWGLDDLRDRIFDLRSPALAEGDLPTALRRYAEECAVRYGFTIVVDTGDLTTALAPGVEMGLFRIVQEALHNVRKHAQATEVVLTLATAKDVAVIACVMDNGQGFDPATLAQRHERSLGLTSMRERAELLGGTFTLHATPGHGATILVRLPHESATAS